jgi:hypothetical protein
MAAAARHRAIWRRSLTSVRPKNSAERCGVPNILVGLESPVHDVWFVLLTIGVFAFLALCVKGVEKL